MNLAETQSVMTLSVLAAFVDGDKHDRERSEIKRIAEGLSKADELQLSSLYQDVLTGRATLDTVVPGLTSPESRRLAYEMAVCVCDADGVQSQAEQQFLAQARSALGLDVRTSAQFTERAEAMASAPLADPVAPAIAAVDSTALDAAILNAAILNGALELLPETLSTMAIIPLQMKLVYRIGKAHGYELDSGHIKDFLATAGVGITSQYLEQAGRKLLGGLLGRLGGGLLRGVGNQAVSSGMSFATTYALGHVARRYYAGGRTLSTQVLKDTYASLTQEAQALQSTHMPAIQQKASTLDLKQIMAMVRGQ